MSFMEAYIIDGVRSATGRKGGSLAKVHPADLGAAVLSELMDRSAVPADQINDVIFGCVDALGPQAGDIARTSWLAAGLPECVPGTTVDRQCGSSQQAVHFAAQGVLSGTQDLVIAGGVQHIRTPISVILRFWALVRKTEKASRCHKLLKTWPCGFVVMSPLLPCEIQWEYSHWTDEIDGRNIADPKNPREKQLH